MKVLEELSKTEVTRDDVLRQGSPTFLSLQQHWNSGCIADPTTKWLLAGGEASHEVIARA